MTKKTKQQPRVQAKHHQSKKEDRYSLGHTLYTNKRYLEALLTWWPILKKHADDLPQKCLEIAQALEENTAFVLQSEHVQSVDDMNKLYMACKHLIPSSSLCIHIERKLLETWWQEKSFDMIERHLKTNFKNEHYTTLHDLLENLGKLAFLQANKKYRNSIPAFIGSVLTGAASLLLNSPAYQPELEAILQALGRELNHVIIQHQHNIIQKYVWDANMLSQWIDYEVGVLTLVLKQAIAHPSHAPDIIATPSYFIQSAVAHTPVGKNFLTWLAAQNKALATLYDTHVQHAVLWVLGGEKISEITDCLVSAIYLSWDPYLQLAIALRAEALKPVSMDDFIIHPKLFLQTEGIQPLKKIALHAAHAIFDAPASISAKRQQAILSKLIELIPNIQDPRLQYMNRCVQRQQDCVKFSNQLDEKKSKKIISALKTCDLLREHLTLIADTALLLPDNDAIDLFWHIGKLIKNKRIQSFIPFKEHFTNHGNCFCGSCIAIMLKQGIPAMAKALDLPLISLKYRADHHDSIRQEESTPAFQSIASKTDPFKTLGVSVHDSKQAIMKKVMTCIQQSPENMASFRQAQHALFDLPQRFLYHYLYHLNVPNTAEQVIYEHVAVA